MNAHKTLFYVALAALLLAPLIAQAGTIYTSPSQGEYREGDTVYVSVFVNPKGDNIYTTKIDVRFSPSIVRVNSFRLNSDWMPLKQPGYDLIDNSQGRLIKTGGYPGGVSSKVLFGTIGLQLKTQGTVQITIGGDTLLLDESNENVLNGSSGSSFSIIERPVVSVPLGSGVPLQVEGAEEVEEEKIEPTQIIGLVFEEVLSNKDKIVKYSKLLGLAMVGFVLETRPLYYIVLGLVIFAAVKLLVAFLRFLKNR